MDAEALIVNRAREAYDSGRREEAVALLESLTRETLPCVQALGLLFKIYAELGWVERAKDTYQSLIVRDINENQRYVLHIGMARAHRDASQTDSALQAIEQAIALKPSAREAYEDLLRIHVTRNTPHLAIEYLERRFADENENAGLCVVLAKAYHKSEWWVEARNLAQKAVQLNPRLAEAQHILRNVEAQIRSNPRCFQEAAQRRERAGDAEGMLRHWLLWAQATGQTEDYVAVGELCERHNRLDLAQFAYERALKLAPDHRRAQEGAQRVHRKKSPPHPLNRLAHSPTEMDEIYEWFVQQGDVGGAIEYFGLYLVRHPDSAPALRILARARQKIGQMEEAAHALAVAIRYSPLTERPDLYVEMASICDAQGQQDKARQALELALRLNPDHLRAKQQLSALNARALPAQHRMEDEWQNYRATGRYEEALEQFRRYRDMDPNAPAPYVYMGHAYEAIRQVEDAYRAHQMAASIKNEAAWFAQLGKFCARHALYARAASAFDMALKLDPHNESAKRGKSQLPQWMVSPEIRLQSHLEKPDKDLLHAMWACAGQQRRSEVTEYLSALAEVWVDEPELFKLLGDAWHEQADYPAAAAAYRQTAFLRGSASSFEWLGDYCFRRKLEKLAIEAYEATLDQNPFYFSARTRLALLRSGQPPSSQYITGDKVREDWARDLCNNPRDERAASRLCASFADALDSAEATYRLLQELHPEQGVFARDLARVYMACDKALLAWREATQALASRPIPKALRADLEQVIRQAEETLRQAGEDPSPSSEPIPYLEDVAPDTAAIWYLRLRDMPTSDSPGEAQKQAQEHLQKAQAAATTDPSRPEHYLRAALFYHQAGQLDLVPDLLVRYAMATGQYHRTRVQGRSGLARTWIIEGMRLAVSRAASASHKRCALMQYLLTYLESLEKEHGSPRAWPQASAGECREVMAAARTLGDSRLAALIGLLWSLIHASRHGVPAPGLQHPRYLAAVVRRRLTSVLSSVPEQDRLSAMVERWTPEDRPQKSARLEISLPWTASLPGAAQPSPERSPAAPEEEDYDLAAVRTLLRGAFADAKDLCRFCADRPNLRPVLRSVSAQPALDDVIDALLWFCRAQVLFAELLAALQEERPRQYEKHQQAIAPKQMTCSPSLPQPIHDERPAEPDIVVAISNTGQVPADRIWIRLNPKQGHIIRESRQFLPLLSAGASRALTFRLEDIPPDLECVELTAQASYYSLTEPQKSKTQVMLTIHRPGRPFNPLRDPFQASWRPDQVFQPNYLAQGDAEEWLRRGQKAGIHWSLEAARHAAQITAGESVSLAFLGSRTVAHLNSVQRSSGEVHPPDVVWVVSRILEEQDASPHFLSLVRGTQTSYVDKLILACLPARGDDPEAWVHQEDLLRDLERWGNRIAGEELLRRAGHLRVVVPLLETRDALDGSSSYRLRSPLLHAWLQKHWLPSQALAHARAAQQDERREQADRLHQKLLEGVRELETYRQAEKQFQDGNMDVSQFTRMQASRATRYRDLLFEVRALLTDEEYAAARQLLDHVLDDTSQDVIRTRLKATAAARGWDDAEIRQKLGRGTEDVFGQIAHFLLDVWDEQPGRPGLTAAPSRLSMHSRTGHQ